MARTSITPDSFNRAALGANWAQINSVSRGDVVIDSSIRITGSFGASGNETCAARWVGAGTLTNDQWAGIKLLNVSNLGPQYRQGVAARMSANTGTARDYYEAYIQLDHATTPTTVLAKWVAGVRTQLASAAQAWATNDRLEIEVTGTTVSVCKNGTALGGAFTVTDTSLTTGSVGVVTTSVALSDDFDGGALASDVTPPVITGPTGAAGASAITMNVAENTTTIGVWAANEAGAWRLAGADAALASITPSVDTLTATVAFLAPRNFEAPGDAGANNVYDLIIQHDDSASPVNTSAQSVAITITNVNEAPVYSGTIPSLSGSAGAAVATFDVAALFSDPDVGDTATYTKTGTAWPASVTLTGSVIGGTLPATAGTTTTGHTVTRTDSGGLTAVSAPFSITTAAPGTITTEPFKNWATPTLASLLVEHVVVLTLAGAVVLALTNQTTNSTTGALSISSGAIAAGTTYLVASWNADGSIGGIKAYTAA